MLCEDEGGNPHELVVKLRAGIEHGQVGLTCELLASLLAGDLDLPIPSPAIVVIEEDLASPIVLPEFAKLVRQSVGLNFGTDKLPPGLNTWPKDRAIPVMLRALAAEIFAFDVLIQNPDRRRDNPNILWKSEELYIFDHDLAFSFVMPTIGWQPPWTGEGLKFFEEHIFHRGLKGTEINLNRLMRAFEAVTDERLQEHLDVVPNEWRTQRDVAAEIITYLTQSRDNRDGIVAAIRRFLR
jgi:hypothetical protein